MIVSKCCKAEVEFIGTCCHSYFACCKCGKPSGTIRQSSIKEDCYDAGYENKAQTFTYCA